MSDKKEVTYLNGISVKEKTFDWGTKLNVSVNVEKFIEELQKHKNEKGWVNLNITKRKSEGTYGETHSVVLDTYVPRAKGEAVNSATTDDLPF